MPTATFAKICAHLENVSDSSATVFDLYQDVGGFDPSGIKWCITQEDFMNNFYDRGVFKMHDCCNNIAVLHNWIVEPSGTDISSAVPFGSDPSNCDLFSLIKQQWILDASNNCGRDISANWGTCSYMNVFRQLIPAGSLCNWDCKVCCALTAKELADVLNYEEYTNNGDAWPAGSAARTNVQPVKIGDCLTLSVRFTNPNPCVDPIELRLHFKIFTSCTISGVWGKTRVGTQPPSINPAPQMWAATYVATTFPPAETSTIATNDGSSLFLEDFKIKINTTDCFGTAFSDLLVPGLWKGRMIRIQGVKERCEVSTGNHIDIDITYHIDSHTVDVIDNFAIFKVTFVTSVTPPGTNFVPFLFPGLAHHTITLFPFLE